MTPEPRSDPEPRFHDECYACPVGGLFLTSRAGAPEAVDHVLNAASEMLAAFKVLADAAERFIEAQRGSTGPPGPSDPRRVRRIHLED
jgi:hypothetical protein